jgi:hypothetical protein
VRVLDLGDHRHGPRLGDGGLPGWLPGRAVAPAAVNLRVAIAAAVFLLFAGSIILSAVDRSYHVPSALTGIAATVAGFLFAAGTHNGNGTSKDKEGPT